MTTKSKTPADGDEKRAFSVKEAARIYGLSRSKLYELMASGRLRSVLIDGRRLLPRDEMEALLEGGVQ